MLTKPWRAIHLLVAVVLLATACTSAAQQDAQPTTTTTTTTEPPERPTVLQIAVVVNDSASTAAADDELVAILTEAVPILTPVSSIGIELQTISVEAPGQAEGAMQALINEGVSVVITGCDDATVPSVIEAAVSSELLTVTGCVSLPRPNISQLIGNIDSELFLDLSNLADNAPAILNHATSEGFESLAIVRSNLVPDVEQPCLDAVANSGDISIAAEITFTELIDAPVEVATVLNGALPTDVELGAIVVCALPPAIGDITLALREQGLDHPVIAPWYADPQTWAEGSGEVTVIAPASRYGNDPVEATTDLFTAMAETSFAPAAVDVVTADALAILVDAAERADSVGSRRIAEMISQSGSDVTVEAISGPVSLDGPNDSPVLREYRVITIDDGGDPTFAGEVSAAVS